MRKMKLARYHEIFLNRTLWNISQQVYIYAVNLLRPLAFRLFKTLLPPTLLSRAKNPWRLFLCKTLGWYVLFVCICRPSDFSLPSIDTWFNLSFLSSNFACLRRLFLARNPCWESIPKFLLLASIFWFSLSTSKLWYMSCLSKLISGDSSNGMSNVEIESASELEGGGRLGNWPFQRLKCRCDPCFISFSITACNKK